MTIYLFLINDKPYYVTHSISKEVYDKWNRYLAVWPRGVIYFTPFLHRLVKASRKEPEFVEFVRKIEAELVGLSTEDKIRGVVDLCRKNIKYVDDKTTSGLPDYWSTAQETMYRGIGDCDDNAIMMASILTEMGIICKFVVMKNHMAIAVAGDFQGTALISGGKKYFYVDSTSKKSAVGVIPDNYKDSWKILFRAN